MDKIQKTIDAMRSHNLATVGPLELVSINKCRDGRYQHIYKSGSFEGSAWWRELEIGVIDSPIDSWLWTGRR